jgi:selenocysteine-specific elongation factor
VAVNLTGVDAQEVERGDVVTLAGLYAPTRRFDARIRLLADSPIVLKHGQAVKVYLGTADVVGRARLLDAEQLEPGKDGWAQIVVDQPIVAADQDRFILRRPTPAATLGGGVVVDPHPARTHRRRDARVLEALEGRGGGRPEERVLVVLSGGVPLGLAELEAGSGVDHSEIQRTLGELVAGGRAVEVSDGAQGRLWATAGWWRATTGSVEKLLQTYHEQFPLRAGMPREELRSRLGLEARTFEAVVSGLEAEGVVARRGSRLARAGYAPKLTSDQARRLEELRDRFAAAPTSPPSVKECRQAVGDELWALVTADGEFVEVSEEVVFDAATYRRIVGEISAALAGGGTITVAELRDRYQTSRKFALALLEHLDALGVTVRSGDERRLKTPQTDRSGPPAG